MEKGRKRTQSEEGEPVLFICCVSSGGQRREMPHGIVRDKHKRYGGEIDEWNQRCD